MRLNIPVTKSVSRKANDQAPLRGMTNDQAPMTKQIQSTNVSMIKFISGVVSIIRI
jgi:hypothetical protein